MTKNLNAGQATFVPAYSTDTRPPPEHANDSECLAVCASTGKLYLCKKNSHPYLAASEWICAHFARACGLPMPNFAPVKIEGRNDYLFGSEWIYGGLSWAVALPSVQNGEIFSTALALDYGISNADRHLENYLYLENDDGVHAEIIDFSRALLVAGWPLPALPMDDMDATVDAIAAWKVHHPFVIESANKVISCWMSLPLDYLEPVLDSMAPGWLDAPVKQRLLDWWTGPGRISRAHEAAYQLKYIK